MLQTEQILCKVFHENYMPFCRRLDGQSEISIRQDMNITLSKGKLEKIKAKSRRTRD